MRKNYQRKERKSNHKFEVVRGQELLVQVPVPMSEVWAEQQAQDDGSGTIALGCMHLKITAYGLEPIGSFAQGEPCLRQCEKSTTKWWRFSERRRLFQTS